MNKRYIMFGFATVALAVLALGAWWWQSEGQYRNIEFVPGDPEFSSNQEYFRYYEALKEAYAEDKYGGDTPEETLQLFIDALKAGDVELASKYFVVEERDKILNDLKESVSNNALSMYIDILSGERDFTHGNKTTTVDFIDKEGVQIHFESFVLNTQTGKWKMYEL